MASIDSSVVYFVGVAEDRQSYDGLLKDSGVEWFDARRDEPRKLAAASAVVVDLPLGTVEAAKNVRHVLTDVKPGVPRLFAIDKNQRVEVVHAGVVGATSLCSRRVGVHELYRFLSDSLQQMHTPVAAAPVSALGASLSSIKSASGSLEDLFMAVTSGAAPDHAAIYAACDEVSDALKQDGLHPWLEAVRSHHQGTMQHCLIVSGVLTRFGQTAGMSDADIRTLTQVGLLHDVGKAVIPTSVLDKPGKLTADEFAVIKTHPYQGFKFLAKHGGVSADILSAVVGHHEYLDGSGYPYALSGKAIDDLVRIATVCDIYGALVEKRSYKPEMKPTDALAILESMASAGKVESALVQVLARSVQG